jgi:hypothetical protein
MYYAHCICTETEDQDQDLSPRGMECRLRATPRARCLGCVGWE